LTSDSLAGTVHINRMHDARKKLAETINFRLDERGMSNRQISERIGASVSEVEKMRDGTLVLDRMKWKRLCGMVARSLFAVQHLYNDALKEQEEERDMVVNGLRRNNGFQQRTSSGAMTNFGDKLVAAGVIDEPRKEPDVTDEKKARKAMPQFPPGAMTDERIAERRAYARDIIRQRPAISGFGDDGLQAILRKRFGVGISPEQVTLLKEEEVKRENYERDIRAKIAAEAVASARPTAPAPLPETERPASSIETPPVSTRAINDADVSAAVEIIIGAIPGLQTLTIEVNEAGEASVSYEVRKIQVQTVKASLTVKRV